MTKYKLLAVMSIGIFLTGCKSLQVAANKPIESYQSSIKEESSANELSDSSEMKTIDSNEGKPMVTEKFEVLLPPFLNNVDGVTELDKNLFTGVQNNFTDKEINIYEDSLTFINGYTTYSLETNSIVFIGIIVNNTADTVTDISGNLGSIKLKNYSDVNIANGSFKFKKEDFDVLKPKQAEVVIITAPVMPTGKEMPTKDIIFEEKEISALPYGFEYRVIEAGN
ncbi:hypothetical protein [Carnobacterium maltaromaticum]|uniref:hypothetical protein n=1 Tax=Carnobacterium maltaromaticum TaxID=2751 RepID=UPI0010725C4D|nr:hypothetical protein [Carnobacterium maltaromaticum]TFJ75634.1 hypothetical protein CKN94_05645 [Carnobacterium maltaromaticum]TFJ78801.1 hypothetical protein CKN97_05640 [Carnobacterium maltaromaticum]